MRFINPNFPLTITLAAALMLSLATESLLAEEPEKRAFTATATSEIDGVCANVDSVSDDALIDAISYMQDQGYYVTVGFFELYDPESSNVHIPFANPDTDYLIAQFDDGTAATRLGGQDIILYPACSPSRSSYFADIVYNTARIHDQVPGTGIPTEFSLLEASVGNPVNARVGYIGNSTTPADPYNAFEYIAVTGDQASFADLSEAFAGATDSATLGTPTLMAIPEEYFIFSADDGQLPRDLVSIIRQDTRILQEHPEAYVVPEEVYRLYRYMVGNTQHTPFYRFSKPAAYPIDPVASTPTKTQPPKAQHKLKQKYKIPFDNLVNEVVDHFETWEGMELVSSAKFKMDGATVDGVETHIFDHSPFCVENEKNCMFDNPDSLYWWDQQSHTLTEDDYYLLVGLDYSRLGVTRYDDLDLYFVEDPSDNGAKFSHLMGRKGSELMQTSEYLQAINGDPKLAEVAERSFLYQVTRPWNCIEDLGDSSCPDTDTLDPLDSFIFTGKLTMNPETGTRPSNGQVIHWRLLHFRVGDGS